MCAITNVRLFIRELPHPTASGAPSRREPCSFTTLALRRYSEGGLLFTTLAPLRFSLRLGHKTALSLSTKFTTVLPLRYSIARIWFLIINSLQVSFFTIFIQKRENGRPVFSFSFYSPGTCVQVPGVCFFTVLLFWCLLSRERKLPLRKRRR